MIKSIGNSESTNTSFDRILSNLSIDSNPTKENPSKKVNKQANDEFQRTFEPQKIEAEITKQLEDVSLEAKFSTDQDTEKLILKIINRDTDEVVRQYPAEVSLKIARIVNSMIENNSVANVRL